MSVDSDGPFAADKRFSLVKRQHWRVKNIRNIVWSVLNFHVNQQKISPSGSVYTGTVWKSAAVHRQSTAIQSTKTLVLPPSALNIPDGAELTVGCNDSPAIVVKQSFLLRKEDIMGRLDGKVCIVTGASAGIGPCHSRTVLP